MSINSSHINTDEMTPETLQLISVWQKRGAREADEFVKFFIFYMCLDAWITVLSGTENESQKGHWIKRSDNEVKAKWYTIKETHRVQHALRSLVNIETVENMHPKHRSEYKYYTDINNFNQFVDFLYQIRCNLFHGGKSPNNIHDYELVKYSATVLRIWLQELLSTTENDF